MGDIEGGQCWCLSNCDGELSGDGCGVPVAKVVVADVEGGERGGHGGDTLNRYIKEGEGGRGSGRGEEGEREMERGERDEMRMQLSNAIWNLYHVPW